MIGKDLEVLFESKNEDGSINGFSSNYVKVQSTYSENLENQFCLVKLESTINGLASGKIMETKNSVASDTFTI